MTASLAEHCQRRAQRMSAAWSLGAGLTEMTGRDEGMVQGWLTSPGGVKRGVSLEVSLSLENLEKKGPTFAGCGGGARLQKYPQIKSLKIVGTVGTLS